MSNEAKSGELTEQEVLRVLGLIDKLEQSGFNYLKLELGDLKLTISKGGLEAPAVAPTPTAATAPPAQAPAAPAPAPAAAAVPTAPAAPSAAPAAPAAPTTDGHLIPSPMVGRFYRASQPGAPPFTEVGAEVNEETTVCLIEVMKVFSAVTAGVKGVVSEILVADGDFVEYGQPLFVVKPAAK